MSAATMAAAVRRRAAAHAEARSPAKRALPRLRLGRAWGSGASAEGRSAKTTPPTAERRRSPRAGGAPRAASVAARRSHAVLGARSTAPPRGRRSSGLFGVAIFASAPADARAPARAENRVLEPHAPGAHVEVVDARRRGGARCRISRAERARRPRPRAQAAARSRLVCATTWSDRAVALRSASALEDAAGAPERRERGAPPAPRATAAAASRGASRPEPCTTARVRHGPSARPARASARARARGGRSGESAPRFCARGRARAGYSEAGGAGSSRDDGLRSDGETTRAFMRLRRARGRCSPRRPRPRVRSTRAAASGAAQPGRRRRARRPLRTWRARRARDASRVRRVARTSREDRRRGAGAATSCVAAPHGQRGRGNA